MYGHRNYCFIRDNVSCYEPIVTDIKQASCQLKMNTSFKDNSWFRRNASSIHLHLGISLEFAFSSWVVNSQYPDNNVWKINSMLTTSSHTCPLLWNLFVLSNLIFIALWGSPNKSFEPCFNSWCCHQGYKTRNHDMWRFLADFFRDFPWSSCRMLIK